MNFAGIELYFLLRHENPVFVFGATALIQTVHNLSLLTTHPMDVRFYSIDGTLHMFEMKDEVIQTVRKLRRVRTAIRPKQYLPDACGESTIECKLCHSNQSCVLVRPCNHLGMCNRCCLRYTERAFYKRRGQITLSTPNAPTKCCPFCKTGITHLEYVYVP